MNLYSKMDFSGRPNRVLDILGVRVADASLRDAISMLENALSAKRFTKVAFLNAHSANTASDDPDFADILNSFLVLPDGIGVDIAAKMLYGHPFADNLNGTDFVPAFLASIRTPLTVGIVGAIRENGERATADLNESMPQHQFVYVNDGFLSAEEEPAVLEKIRALRPDILLVAMGVPRQEKWIEKNLDRDTCTMPIAVGALLDFLSGAVPRAPMAVRRLRMEWVYRLCLEPSRLWRRYILGNPIFLLRVMVQKFRLRRTKATA